MPTERGQTVSPSRPARRESSLASESNAGEESDGLRMDRVGPEAEVLVAGLAQHVPQTAGCVHFDDHPDAPEPALQADAARDGNICATQTSENAIGIEVHDLLDCA